MAPQSTTLLQPRHNFDLHSSTLEFRAQWVSPGDVFSLLLILGGDIVWLALAQLVGSPFSPVAFSFGWVAYSISALVAALGSGKLMPREPDCDCKVINAKSGYSRDNTSWVIGRIMRDLDSWLDPASHAKVKSNCEESWARLKQKDPDAARPTRAGLVVSVYEPSKTITAGRPGRDWLWWSGLVTILLQLGLAAVPLGVYGDWGIFFIMLTGTALSIVTGSLPQWKLEKWACRKASKSPYIITEGNGSQHAIVILGNGHGLNLEDLSTGQTGLHSDKENQSRICLFILTVLWILLLITATGIKQHTWFLVGIGTLGIIQNILLAGCKRKPAILGIPLDFVEVHGHASVMETLFIVEDKYPGIGRNMRDEFFPGKLRPDEIARWEAFEAKKG